MKSLTKKIFVGLMAGSLFLVGVPEVYAAEKNPPPPPNQQHMQEHMDAWAKHVAEWSGVNEKDILAALKNEKTYEDVEVAAMLSKISKKPFKEVLAMKNDWSDVMKKLGITHEKYEATIEEVAIKRLSNDAEIDENLTKSLLERHYFPRDIIIAGKLAKASGKNIQEVLDMKKINQRWRDVAKDLNVSEDISDEAEPQEHGEFHQPPENQ